MPGITPSQTVGPFFAYGLTPRAYGRRELATNDMITPDASGTRIRIEGRVFDGAGAAVGEALVELWQADAAGRYAHPADGRARPNSAFKGFGRAEIEPRNGSYFFETIKPGAVPGPDGTPMAPHINVSIFARGVVRRMFTRIYFPDESANANDPILRLVPADRRQTLIARAEMRGAERVYVFDIRLQGEGETVFFES